ncbi:hypothetical protein WJX82_011670 [Trebouxia sp. C0006]
MNSTKSRPLASVTDHVQSLQRSVTETPQMHAGPYPYTGIAKLRSKRCHGLHVDWPTISSSTPLARSLYHNTWDRQLARSAAEGRCPH